MTQAMYCEKACLVCGDEITGVSPYHCKSRSCWAIWSNYQRGLEGFKKRIRNCEWCNNTLLNGHDYRLRFCNTKCRSLATAYGTKDKMSFILLLRSAKNRFHLRWRSKQSLGVCAICGSDILSTRKSSKPRVLCDLQECKSEHSRRTTHDYYHKKNGKRLRGCSFCGNEFEHKYKSGLRGFCSENCREEKEKQQKRKTKKRRIQTNGKLCNHRRRARFYGVPYEQGVTKKALLKVKGNHCGICGGKLTSNRYPDPTSTSVDHIIPLSAPGSPGHVISNVQLAHLRCNVDKGATVDSVYQMVLL